MRVTPNVGRFTINGFIGVLISTIPAIKHGKSLERLQDLTNPKILYKMKEKVIKLSSKTIDITPSWKSSVEMMLLVLNNPKASKESKQVCHEELLRLADIVDNLKK